MLSRVSQFRCTCYRKDAISYESATLHNLKQAKAECVVYRSNNNANANGGISYANANNGSSNANTNIGVRLDIHKC